MSDIRRKFRSPSTAKRLAAQGYSVLVPNPFYRVGKAPFFTDASTVNFQADRAKIMPLMASVTAAGNAEKDATAYIAFLDEQKQVNKSKKIGAQGYCMGGALLKIMIDPSVPASVRVRAADSVLKSAAQFSGGNRRTRSPRY